MKILFTYLFIHSFIYLFTYFFFLFISSFIHLLFLHLCQVELSLDDPHISVESDDVINGKSNTYFKKRKKLKCSATSNFDRNVLLNEYGERGNDRGSGVEEYNTQEQRTPTKRKRNVYFADAININHKNKNKNKNDSNMKTNNDNNRNDIGIREAYTSRSRKLGNEETLKKTDMVRKPYFHHKHILFKLIRNIKK